MLVFAVTKMCLALSILFEQKSKLFLTLLVHSKYLSDLPSPFNRGQVGITKKIVRLLLSELKTFIKTLRLISKKVIEEDKI